jgi:DNA-directed RNA polymerase specialized sigma24 family protein
MAEIASVLELPPGTVASRLRRGREAFERLAAAALANGGLP